jgi:hypothetical protein
MTSSTTTSLVLIHEGYTDINNALATVYSASVCKTKEERAAILGRLRYGRGNKIYEFTEFSVVASD